MEADETVIAALRQQHEDIKELTRVVGQNHQKVVDQNAGMRRLYIVVIGLAFIAMFFYPWLETHLP